MSNTKRTPTPAGTEAILRHWREAVPNDRLAHLVKDAWRGLSRSLQVRITAHGVSFGHWTFLRILWETDGLTQRELSEQAGLMEPTTFSALKAMERLGYIERRRMPDSRKKVYVFLTPKGRALRAKLVPLALQVNESAVEGITVSDIAVTRRTLLVMIENLARDEAASEKKRRRIPSTRELARRLVEADAAARTPPRKRAAKGRDLVLSRVTPLRSKPSAEPMGGRR